jgi:hypothetical protein
LVLRLNQETHHGFEAKPGETVVTGFEAKPEKTVATGFQAKPEKTVTTGFEVKPEKTICTSENSVCRGVCRLVCFAKLSHMQRRTQFVQVSKQASE